MLLTESKIKISQAYSPKERAVVFPGDCLRLLSSLPNECLSLVVTSPPYNIGKSYEKKNPLAQYVDDGAIVPLDYGLAEGLN